MVFQSILFFAICTASIFKGADSIALIPRLICYPEQQAGCENKMDFAAAYPKLSKSASNRPADTHFIYYPNNISDTPQRLDKCGGRLLPNTTYFRYEETVIIIPSLTFGYCDTAVYREMKTQLLERKYGIPPQVIVVDYNSWIKSESFATIVENSKIVAKQIVQILKNIKKDRGISANNDIILFGDGLGAQIAGFVGALYQEDEFLINDFIGREKIGRIVALDPLRFRFPEDAPPEERLDFTDATLVDVWHTNMGDCFPTYGINYTAGAMDLFINGGKSQKGCYKYALQSILKGDILFGITALVLPDYCSHAFAAEVFKVSINGGCCEYVAFECKDIKDCQSNKRPRTCQKEGDCRTVGFRSETYYLSNNRGKRGLFYVKTSFDCPYCISDQQDLGRFARDYKRYYIRGCDSSST